MIKSLRPLLLLFQYEKVIRIQNEKGRLIQNPNYEIPSRPLHTSERTVLIERERRFHIFLSRNEMAGEREGSLFLVLGYSGKQIQWRRDGACSSED